MNGRKARALRRLQDGRLTEGDLKIIRGHLDRLRKRSKPTPLATRLHKIVKVKLTEKSFSKRNLPPVFIKPVRALIRMAHNYEPGEPPDTADVMTLGAAKTWAEAGRLPRYILSHLAHEAAAT